MKKLIYFLLLLPAFIFGQVSTGQEQFFDYGVQVEPSALQSISTPAYFGCIGIDGTVGKTAAANVAKPETRVAINDADYTITGVTNQLIAYTNLTTSRTVNLPAATTANQRIWITDESGLASSARQIIVVPNGSDTVSGGTNTVVNFPNGSGYFESNGSGKWNIISTTSVQFSAGVNTLPTITDLGTGSVTLGAGVYSLFANTTGVGRPKAFAVSGSTFALTDQMTTYITAQYNTSTGLVSLVATTVESTINYTTVIPIFKIFRDGLVCHISDYDSLGVALSNKLQKSWEKTQQYRFEPGGVLLGESATRIITLTSGTVWRGAVEIPLTSVASNVQTCYQFVNTSGTWSKSVITQYNNTQWNDVAGLATLSGGRYGVSFVYRSIGNDTDIAVVLGTGDYNLGQAQTSSPPTNLPTFITSHMVLVGRIIVLKSATTSTQIDSANTTGVIFTSAGVTDHNALMNLQTAQTGVTYGHITDAAQTISGTKTFTDIVATTVTSPDLLHLAGAETVTGVKTFSSGTIGHRNVANTFTSFITNTNTASRTYTLPDFDGSIAAFNGGNLGIGTSSPTHPITLSSTASANGIALYNTVDQTTNFERLRVHTSSNQFRFISENGGTGTVRDIIFRLSAVHNFTMRNAITIDGVYKYLMSTGSVGSLVGISGAWSASSQSQNGLAIVPTISQTSTAGYRGLWISTFENTLGSGSKLLIDAGTNTAADGGGTHTSKFTVDNAGAITGKSIAVTNGTVRLFGYTVATLPAGVIGDTAYVTDATAPTFLATVVGGGSVVTPVFYNGTNWVAH